jgi:hypothetical protein
MYVRRTNGRGLPARQDLCLDGWGPVRIGALHPSDHRMAIMTPTARTCRDRGPALKRVRCDFTALQDLADRYRGSVRLHGASGPSR